MALNADTRYSNTASRVDAAEIDAGLRKYMLGVYNYMASGLLVSAIVALLVSSSPAAMQTIFGSGLGYVVMFAPLGILLVMSFAQNKLSTPAIQGLYWAMVAIMGVSLSTIFIRYGMGDVVRVFFITAASFAGLSLFGYTTKKNLSGMGSFLVMGLIGLVIAMVVNMFVESSMMQFVISVLGVLIFAGLTAFDTQRIKSTYIAYRMEGDVATRSAVMDAVGLYLNFVNMFVFLLHLFGGGDD
ncbi:Bax inhibitor-1/YccA family protein [Minwuia sp.]|uniref:Bax inhibitor-1/YccA family protein n=1 Tax=Minwuia sp. TaxID=2493630 RepID=UPI003A929D41